METNKHKTEDGYLDVIGDVHGCITELIQLLTQLGYQEKNGIYQHSHRKAVFVGDVVDRGTHIRETLQLIKAMVQAKAAYMVLGNHELNWLNSSVYCATKGDYLRRHTPRNTKHQKATFRAFDGRDAEQRDMLQWLRGLPLWLEIDGIRIAHAGWSNALRDVWQATHGERDLDDDMLRQIVTNGTLEQRTIKAFTCGATIPLPSGYTHVGHDGQERGQIRAKFWHTHTTTYGEVVFPPDTLPANIAKQSVAPQHLERIIQYQETEPPLLVGHYSLLPLTAPSLLTPNIACVDYACFAYKQLVCYQHPRGSSTLTNANFISTQSANSSLTA